MPRPRGYVPDEMLPGRRPSFFVDLVAASVPPPSASDGILRRIGPAVDQGPFESCVGEAVAHACYAAQPVDKPRIYPSSRWVWYLARKAIRAENKNVGCRPQDAYGALYSLGFPPEQAFPRTLPLDCAPDDPVLTRLAVDEACLIEPHRIGSGAVRSIRQALGVLHRPVTLALPVGPAYDAYENGVYEGDDEQSDGWHYVLCTHYDERGLFHLGSYGRDWGNDGFCLVDWQLVEDCAQDVWAVQYRPLAEAA